MTELRKIFIADGAGGWLAGVDEVSEALEVIDYHHHEIHEGDAFTAEVHTTGGTALNIAFATPAGTKRCHMTASFTTESKAHLTVLKGATWTTNTGTVYAPVNQRHDSSNTSIVLEDKTATPAFTAGGVLTNVTSPTGGSTARELYVFSAKQAGGGDLSTREEMILDVDETYVITLDSDDGSKGMQLRLEWYEHTDSN